MHLFCRLRYIKVQVEHFLILYSFFNKILFNTTGKYQKERKENKKQVSKCSGHLFFFFYFLREKGERVEIEGIDCNLVVDRIRLKETLEPTLI